MGSIRKNLLISGLPATAFNSATRTFDAMDVTNYKTVGVQVDVVGGGSTGTGKLQWSINGIVFEDIPAANATTIAIAGTNSYYMQAINLGCAQVRVSITSTNVTNITVTGTMIGKEF